jgi:hypothetical protein
MKAFSGDYLLKRRVAAQHETKLKGGRSKQACAGKGMNGILYHAKFCGLSR